MTHHSPFIINLTKTSQGYTFHSLEELDNPPSKPKKIKPVQPKSSTSKLANRLIKEIGLSGDIPPIIPQQNAYQKQPHNPYEDIPKNETEYQQQEQEVDCQVTRQTELPESPAIWFNIKDIHETQIQHFPEFFTGRGYKTPQIYQTYRNFMVEAYHKNKKRYLTFVACRRVLKGDVNCLLRIYKFLVEKGIINFGLNVDGNYTFKQVALGRGFEIEKKPQSCLKKIPQVSEKEKQSQLDTDNLTVTVINKNFSRTYRVYCANCKLICGVVWYVLASQEEKTKSLCTDCYNGLNEQEASTYIKTDITKKMDSGKQARTQSKTNWGLEDNIKLLEFMGSGENKNWNDIVAQFQGKKSLEDIIVQFMQFPITNFNPSEHESKLSHNQVRYQKEEHIKMLQDLYQKSPYTVKEQTKLETKESSSFPTSKFQTLTNLILSKYLRKLNELRELQSILEQTNLQINEQIQVNRVRNTRADTNLAGKANASESEIKEEE